MANLNVPLSKPWFHKRFKLLGPLNLGIFTSIMIHVIHNAESRAKTFTIEKVDMLLDYDNKLKFSAAHFCHPLNHFFVICPNF